MNLKHSYTISLGIHILYLLQLALLGWMVWCCDCQFATTLSPRANFLTLCIVALFSLPYLLAGKRRLFVAGFTGFAIGMLILSFMDQTAEKAMNRLAGRIQPGMTRARVETLAADYFPLDGRFGLTTWQAGSDSSRGILSNHSVVMVVHYSPDGLVQSTEVGD